MCVNKREYFCSWSGGKESALSLYRAQQKGIPIRFLVTMVHPDGKISRSHGIKSYLLEQQAEAMGIPLVQGRAGWDTYEEEFKKVIQGLRKNNIGGGIFGDIDIEEHRDWVERICRDIDMKAILPLWEGKREELLEEFIQTGFKALVVVTNSDFLGKEWLGRQINKEFVKELRRLENIDLCGEKGEYHTFVYDGPVFKRSVEFSIGEETLRDKHWFLRLKTKEDE
ncbi:MAG: diphthine--ammonia ligase [Thermodesulfobacteriota bacterium]|nr:diphthine--ammonia ligase [Thermodesulfobacteriota bacterium]